MINKIKLNTLPSSTDSVVHLAVHVNSEKDNGVLYLTQSEYDIILSVLRQGAFTQDVEFEELDQRSTQEYDYEY
jgi:hypothetical protein